MPANTFPIFPKTPAVFALSLAAVAACTTRAPTPTAGLAAANIFELCDVSANGRRVDKIQVQACSTAIGSSTVGALVGIWLWNGETAFLIDEIQVIAATPSTSLPAFSAYKTYTTLVIPAGFKLYASVTAATTMNTTALSVIGWGGDY